MHVSSSNTMRRCLKRHLLSDQVLGRLERPRVLDVGGADYNGSYRPMFERIGADYTAADIADGRGVDVVMAGPDHLPFDDACFDVVVCGQTFEHSPRFWALFAEMVRVCQPDGIVIVVAPSTGPVHRFPVDCYRFHPDAFTALGEAHDLLVLDTWSSPFGPFHDLVGVFSRRERHPEPIEPDRAQLMALEDPVQNDAPDEHDPVREAMRGIEPARDFLGRLHRTLQPRNYLEIGVWRGFSLAKAKCPSIGIDPFPEISVTLKEHHRVMEMTAEDFFENHDPAGLVDPLDLAYIDGLHLLEHALADFMRVEACSHPGTLIVIDDVFPNHPAQASRQRVTKAWTGDVWKIRTILALARPDLVLVPIDTHPTGSLLVVGADPTNRTLWDAFDLIMANEITDREPDEDVLRRRGSIAPTDPVLDRIVRLVRTGRDRPEGFDVDRIRRTVAGAWPRQLVRA